MRNSRAIGSVGSLWRYPVKSMLGEPLDAVNVETRGLRGDRICAFMDVKTGKVASAKLPHRWQKLLTSRAAFREGEISIELPDGRFASPAEAEPLLSALLGRELRAVFDRAEGLAVDRADPEAVTRHGASVEVEHEVMHVGIGAPEGGFFDAMPIHLATDLSLAAAGENGSAMATNVFRFRPNIVIASEGSAPFEENDWIGKTLSIGKEVRIAVLLPTPRCAVPALRHGAADPDMQILRRLEARNKIPVLSLGNRICLGAYGKVLVPGRVYEGDAVALQVE